MEITTKYGVIYNVEDVTYYDSGELQSIRLGKDTLLTFSIKAGKVTAKEVITFYKTGEIKSFEPAYGTRVKTFIGVVNAFDSRPEDQQGKDASLQLTKAGEVIQLSMVETAIVLIAKDGTRRTIMPQPIAGDVIVPIQVKFLRNSIQVTDSFGFTECFSYREYFVQNITCNKKNFIFMA